METEEERYESIRRAMTSSTSASKDKLQQTIFTRWLNIYLEKVQEPTCNDLIDDVSKGVVLLALLQGLTGEPHLQKAKKHKVRATIHSELIRKQLESL